MDYVQATQVAASIGQGLALLLGFVGLFSNPFLVFIALFVWIGAAGEAAIVQMKVCAARHSDQPRDDQRVPDALAGRFADTRRGSRPDWLSA
jgi:hypothetical protein